MVGFLYYPLQGSNIKGGMTISDQSELIDPKTLMNFNWPVIPVQSDDMGARSTVTVYCMPAFEVAETSAAILGGNSGGQEASLCTISSQHVYFLIV